MAKACLLSNIARIQAIRLLIETALYSPISTAFGAIVKPDPDTVIPAEVSLLKENIKQVRRLTNYIVFCATENVSIFFLHQGNTLMVAQSAMSVFHTGIIGSGLQEVFYKSKLSPEKIKSNTQHLMSVVRSCCLADVNNIDPEVVKNIALLLVQLISPDVMFNGLPWPEEEFCKVCPF